MSWEYRNTPQPLPPPDWFYLAYVFVTLFGTYKIWTVRGVVWGVAFFILCVVVITIVTPPPPPKERPPKPPMGVA